jgi:hypothetical protein
VYDLADATLEAEAMTETMDWASAPKDGAEINIQFRDGTKNRTRWSVANSEWQVPYEGGWRSMSYVHGSSEPVVWWPIGC